MSNENALAVAQAQDLQVTYIKAANPAMSLEFAIPDIKRALAFYNLLVNSGPNATGHEVAAFAEYPELQPLADLFGLYGVTVLREREARHDVLNDLIDGMAKLGNQTRTQAINFIAGSATAGLFEEAATHFYVTTPAQTDLMRLYTDMYNLSRRHDSCGQTPEPWLRLMSFRDNAVLFPHTLDQTVARMKARTPSLRLSETSLMPIFGPALPQQNGLHLADSVFQFCTPA